MTAPTLAPSPAASRHRLPQFPSDPMRGLSYALFGPTTIHLQYECYLLLSLTLLTVSSLQGLYKDSFGTTGDFGYLLLTTLWLSRHLLFRWLCTWDASTSSHPSVTGFLSHFITTHITGGQVQDRPTATVVAKQVGTPGPRANGSCSFANLLPSSLLYLIQILWMWVFMPLLDFMQAKKLKQSPTGRYEYRRRSVSNNNRDSRLEQTLQQGSIQRILQKTLRYVNSVWVSYGPTLQFLLPVSTLCYYAWILSSPFCTQQTSGDSVSVMSTNSKTSGMEHIQPHGAYRKMERPSFDQVWFSLTVFGTLASILLCNRLFLPIPDQVAGSSVIKDVRNEARSKSTSSKTTKGGSSGSSGKDNPDAVWTERHRSITTENRVSLTLKVVLIRFLDNLLVCGILPRTSYACRATGHCSAGAQVWQLSKVLYPAGITSALRKDGVYGTAFSLLQSDSLSAVGAVLGVVMVTGVLLLAQSINLNMAYLAIVGYICDGEWTLVEETEATGLSVIPTTWDPRRKYKKGDLISYPPGSRRASVYRATSHSPEGRPYGRYLQGAHQLLRNELGSPGTSELILKASTAQLAYVILNAILWCGLQIMGYPAHGLLMALVANLVATHAVLDVGSIKTKQLEQLSAEITASQ